MRLLAALLLILSAAPATPAQGSGGAILIYSGTTGYRHDSIPAGINALAVIATRRGLDAVTGEDPAVFSDASLSRFNAIVLLSCTTLRRK